MLHTVMMTTSCSYVSLERFAKAPYEGLYRDSDAIAKKLTDAVYILLTFSSHLFNLDC
jgi:hypothetical protein